MNKGQARDTILNFYAGGTVAVQEKINVLEVYLRDRKRLVVDVRHPQGARAHDLLDAAFQFACGWYVQNPHVLLED